MNELICIKFLESINDFSKGAIQEMIYDMGMNYILDGFAEEITKEEYNKICLEKQFKQAKIKIKNKKQEEENNKLQFFNFQKNIIQLIALKERNEATEQITKYLEKKYNFKTTRIDDNNEVWIYKEGIYLPEGKSYIQEEVRIILEKNYTTQLVNQIISKIEADTFIEQDIFFNKQNEQTELIPIIDGLLNIKSKEILPFTDKIYYFNKLPLKFNKTKNCNKFINFLKDILKKEEDIKIVQELFGYCLYKKYKWKRSFMFEGGGDNGKSQLLKILTEKFLGIENCKNLSLSSIEGKDNFMMAELQNKLVNVSADITDEAVNDSGNFKNLTGGDPVSCNRKFKNTATFVNYAKMIFATNELPITKDDSGGFWGRWILIEFPNRFLPENEYNLLSEGEKENCKIAITNIIENICDENELSGILNWSLEGYARLRKQDRFSYTESRNDTKRRWLMKANSVLAFINDYIVEDYDGYCIKTDFKQNYLNFCKNHKLKVKSDKVIKITLENELGAYSDRKIILQEQKHVWSGIKLVKVVKVAMVNELYRENENSPKSQKTMEKLTTLTNLNIDILRDFIKEKQDFSFDYLSLELKQHYDFNENQLNNYLKKLCEVGEIVEMPKGIWRKI